MQPLGMQVSTESWGAPSASSAFVFCLGNVTNREIHAPPADMQIANVASKSFSAKVIALTCFLPSKENNFESYFVMINK